MRIAVEHRTHYRFTEPQARVVQLLRMRPCDTAHQAVVAWRIDVDCDARLRKGEDGFGNETTMLYADGPLEEFEIAVSGEVLTLAADGVIGGAAEPLPPVFFLRTTRRTLPGPDLPAFARDAAGATGDLRDRLGRLGDAFHRKYQLIKPSVDRGIRVTDAFGRTHASVRDLAQMFVAAARTLEVPARYVSGYRHDDSTASAPHAWAEAYIDGLGWVSFDPSNGQFADDRYVRVAVALDAGGAAFLAGHRVGAGDEELDVDVHVDRLGTDA